MAKEKVNKKKSDKPGFFARLGNFFKGLKAEFKKITWANTKATLKNFGIVLLFLIAFAVVIGLLDLGIGAFFDWLHDAVQGVLK